jgi:hypothetical protein
MNILICGDRDYKDWKKIQDYLKTLNPFNDVIIHGAAKGADSLAGNLAISMNIKVIEFPAKWEEFNRAAGSIRNQQMIDEGHPDLVVYFHDNLNGSKGTKDMVNRATRINIPILANP